MAVIGKHQKYTFPLNSLCRHDQTDKGGALHREGKGRVKDIRAQGFQGSRISETDDISMSGRVQDVGEINSSKRKNFNKETKYRNKYL